jgi:hypothetical protein
MSRCARCIVLCLLVLFGLIFPAGAVTPKDSEFRACRQWFEGAFGTTETAGRAAFLRIGFEDAPGEGITRGRSWRGTPYRIADKTYAHGIAFN